MAKKGSVKKGFAGYLLILFIAILAAFLILITIMMFSPFKNILGFKYFVYDYSEIHQKVTSGEDKINFNNIKTISVDCNTADVEIRREYKIDESSIQIQNRSIGFARGDQDTSFSYEINLVDSNVLTITVREPEGFLFIKKNITISILIPPIEGCSLENTDININTTKGNVRIGNGSKIINEPGKDQFNYLSCKKINIKTTKGDVILLPYVDKINDLFIKTTKGDITVQKSVNVNDFQIYCPNGKIELNNVNTVNAKMELGNSYFTAKKFETKGVAEFFIEKGDFYIENMIGALTSNDMIGDLSSAKIKIGSLKGNLSIPNATGASITVNKVEENSQLRVEGTKSKVNINDVLGESKVWVILTSGSANVHTHSKNMNLQTTSGTINLDYDCNEANSDLYVKSESGTINFAIPQTLKFTLDVHDSSDQRRNQKNVNIEGQKGYFTIPFEFGGGSTTMTLITDGKVNVTYLA